ncbi:MAG: DUF1722 domain-containing protein [Spartobacteria bacterium]|nr:DUF1722 domain-containing protein [Spartobacteria bacterium]
MAADITLGISTCLLGEAVRYDGQHKLDHWLKDTLGQFVTYVPVCPEVESGFPIPREAFRLVGDVDAPRLETQKTGIDCTEIMRKWARRRLEELAAENLDGFIFKSRSPSSGMERVKVYPGPGKAAVKKGRGLFAGMFMDCFPLLPVEEDGRLHDPALRENFIERIFVMKRWRQMFKEASTRHGLVDFHARHKMQVMAHSIAHYRQLGTLVANLKGRSLAEVQGEYLAILMDGLKRAATIKKNVNVLDHMAGYFKKDLTHDEKQELREIIDEYHNQYVPLIVPVTLLNHYVRKYEVAYLKQQHYLNPHPLELKLRNHA